MNIAGPLATLIFAITVLTVFGGLFAYGVYKARERTRKKPASTKKVLQYFVEYAIPNAVGAEGPGLRPAPAKEGKPWGLYLVSTMAIVGLVGAVFYYYRSGRRLVLQGAWSEGTGASKEFPGPPDRGRPHRGPPVSLGKLSARPASHFPKPRHDLNRDGVLSRNELAQIQTDVPLTLLIVVDDNGHAQGLRWLLDSFERFGVWGRLTFFLTGNYVEGRPSYLGGPIGQWWSALSNENFVGLHGQTHETKTEGWSTEKWLAEHTATMAEVQGKVRAPEGWTWDSYAWGSRAPFLAVTEAYFGALDRVSPRVRYDASMVVHPTAAASLAPRELVWPFSLEGDLPAEVELPFSEALQKRVTIGKHPLLEVPVYAWAVRRKGGALGWIPSTDVTLFEELGCTGDGASRAMIEAFEQNLRAHYEGNRAPFHLGLHAQNYTADRKCERATLEVILATVQALVAKGWRLEYQSMPRLLEWMAAD